MNNKLLNQLESRLKIIFPLQLFIFETCPLREFNEILRNSQSLCELPYPEGIGLPASMIELAGISASRGFISTGT